MIAISRQSHAPTQGARIGARPLYAIGDVHGCYDLLQALLAEISRDARESHPDVTPILILCGDYVDCGPATAKVLAALVWLARSSAVEARMLEGNHEAMLRQFLDDPAERSAWLKFGGRQTLESYGVPVPDEGLEFAATAIAMRDALLDLMPAAHERLLSRLEPCIEVGDYIFVHAGIRPGVPLAKQTRKDMLWIREEFLEHAAPAPPVIVHGHTWIDDKAVVLPHRIGIDTGAYETGVLTAVKITDEAVDTIQARRDGEQA
ncbi:metallophosphoesterase [Sphingomonas sp. RS2018]